MRTKIIYEITHAYLTRFLKNKNSVVFVNVVNVVHYWKKSSFNQLLLFRPGLDWLQVPQKIIGRYL